MHVKTEWMTLEHEKSFLGLIFLWVFVNIGRLIAINIRNCSTSVYVTNELYIVILPKPFNCKFIRKVKKKKIGWSVIVRRCEDHIRHVCLMNESIVREPPRTYGNCVFNYSISLSHCERNKFPHDHYSIREWKMVVANSFIRSIWVMGRVEVRKCLQQLEAYVHQAGECINILLFHLYWPENDSVIVVLSHVVNHKLCGCVWGSNHVTS